MKVITGAKEYYPSISQIKYEGVESDNPLCFRWYDENRIVAGKTMKSIFVSHVPIGIRFAAAVPTRLESPHIYFRG
jgi:xylose isomerase